MKMCSGRNIASLGESLCVDTVCCMDECCTMLISCLFVSFVVLYCYSIIVGLVVRCSVPTAVIRRTNYLSASEYTQ